METGTMENIKGRTKKRWREELYQETEVEGRRKVWDWELTKYYIHKEAAISPDVLERLCNFEKTAGEEQR
jgi:aminopeptidase-like protein